MKAYLEWIDYHTESLNKHSVTIDTSYKGGIKKLVSGIDINMFRGKNVLEFGTYNGYSANHLARKVKWGHVYGFDSWQGLPEDWNDIVDKGHFAIDSLPAVKPNVTLVPGWFDKTLEPFLDSHPDLEVGIVHIDCDIYSSTKYVLDILYQRKIIKPGLIILFNELFNYNGFENGELKALYELTQAHVIKFKWLPYQGKIVDIEKTHKFNNNFNKLRRYGYYQSVGLEII